MAKTTWSTRLAAALLRRKAINFESSGENGLARVLNTFDLTTLGIGCTIGSGIYVITGQVALKAGPAVLLSYVIAGFASIFAGLCYAEFGALVPRAGSAYIYSYVTVGEFMAFVIGWNLTLEYIIGTAAVARATSDYIDSLSGNVISHWFAKTLPLHVRILSEYPDLLALAIIIILTAVLCFGVKESSQVNTIFTIVNLGAILYVIICGCFKADTKNWRIPESFIPNGNKTKDDPTYDHGGFFPFGTSGMLSGAASCFYAFAGFDVIATTGEEVMNPAKSIPISITLTLAISGVCYIATAAILTLIYPYYLLNESAPLSMAFRAIGWEVAYYIISIGAICSLATALLAAMFPMPRIIYAMARDGLVFKFLAKINKRTRIPVRATMLAGILAGIMATFFDVKQLVDMMSIGTLLAYTLVSACVLLLRYEVYIGDSLIGLDDDDDAVGGGGGRHGDDDDDDDDVLRKKFPTEKTNSIVKGMVIGIALLTLWLSLSLDYMVISSWWSIVIITIPAFLIVVFVAVIAFQPRNSRVLTFQVPLVPFIPALSVIINIYLMLKLGYETWIRFAVWLVIGGVNYFGYGMRHSREHKHHLHSLTGPHPDDVTDDVGRNDIEDNYDEISNEDDDINDEEIVGSFPGAHHHPHHHQGGVRRSFNESGRFVGDRENSVVGERTPLLV